MIKGKLDVSTVQTDKDNYSYINYDFTPEVRYYFNPQSTWKFFAGASVGLRTLRLSNAIRTPKKFTNHDFHKSFYVGLNKFLNKEIAIEGTLGVNHSNLLMAEDPRLSINARTNVYTTGLNLSINHFTNFKTSEADFKDLVSKGRTVIAGNLSLNRYSGAMPDLNDLTKSISRKGNYATLNAEYGKFVTNGLLIGAKTNIILSDNYKLLGITPYAQYFYPVSKKLMLHAKAELDYNITKYDNYGTFKVGIGATYFLSKNVALNFDVLNFNKNFGSNFSSNNKYLSSNIGLRFFLK